MAAYRVLAFTVLPLLRWRIDEIEGLENIPTDHGCILVANHQSWIDSGILAGAVYQRLEKSIRFVAQSSKYRMFGGIPINEYDKSKVLDIAQGYLKVGHPIVIFPEGNSNKNPELRTGKTGAARLAMHSGAPIIPIGIQGTEGVKAWQAIWWYLTFWRSCRVVIGEPFTIPTVKLASVSHEQLMSATNDIMQRISHVSGKRFDPNQPPTWMTPSKVFLERIIWGLVLPLIRWRVKVQGGEHLPRSGAFIVAGNHTSYFDPGALMIAVVRERNRRPFFLTKQSIAKVWRRFLGRNAWQALGMLPIDNQAKSDVLLSAETHLRHGGIIGIFPEGTRNKPKLNPHWQTHLLKAKTGVARLVVATGVPVIPVGIEAPRGHSISGTLFNVLTFWKPVHVTFGPAVKLEIPAGDPSKETLEAISRSIMKSIAELSHMSYAH